MATTKKNDEVMTTSEEKLFDYYAPKSRELQEDIKVCVNGNWTIIQRGENVKVTESVYEVLMNKQRMENLALDRQKDLQDMQ